MLQKNKANQLSKNLYPHASPSKANRDKNAHQNLDKPTALKQMRDNSLAEKN